MPSRRLLLAGSALVLCAWCGWVSGFRRATMAAGVTWAISLVVVVVVDVLLLRGRRHRSPGLRVRATSHPWPPPGRSGWAVFGGVAPWLTLVLVVAAWEALGIDTGKHTAHLTISALTQAFRPLNAAMLLLWMSVGIGYGVTRARTPLVGSAGGTAPPTPTPGLMGSWWPGGLLWGPAWGGHTPVWRAAALLLPNNRGVGVAFWLGVVAVGVVLDLLARRSGGRLADGEQLLRFVTAPVAANVVAVVAWTYAGYHLFAH